jgi:LPS-assembly protein
VKLNRLIFVLLPAIPAIACILFSQKIHAQGALTSKQDTTNLFDQFQQDQMQDITDQERMKREVQEKRQRYQSLMTKKSFIYFQADRQEFLEIEKKYILSGSVSIWKDDFKLKADNVQIDQWMGDILASGNVEVHFGKDLLTGSEAYYNFDTGKGWVTEARAAVEPALFMEGAKLEKLPDYDLTGEAQYALHDGFVTSCSGTHPNWSVKAHYAVIRLDNYAQMNRSSFWISRIPVFYLPYWYYPTKADRATGLLIPNVSFSARRGLIASEEFFLVLNDYMDMTFGGTYYSRVGFSEEFQWRNALDQYSRGEMNLEHLKEARSPSIDQNPHERWRGLYEQSYILPWDGRATANLDFRSDQYFDRDYGYELEQQADRFMENRVSVTKYWSLSHLTLDGLYEKDFDRARDETIQHIPRLDYGTGWQTIIGSLKTSVGARAEYLLREGRITTIFPDENSTLLIEDWLKRDGQRADINGQLRYDFKELAWVNFSPWISLRESWWSLKKNLDYDNWQGTWATYPLPLEPAQSQPFAGVHPAGEGLRRDLYSYGIDWLGPRFYHIYPLLGFSDVSKIKHLIEPKINFRVIPEVLQDEIIEFDDTDHVEPGQILTYSITNRFLAKIPLKKEKPKKEKNSETGKESPEDQPEKKSEEKSSPENAAPIPLTGTEFPSSGKKPSGSPDVGGTNSNPAGMANMETESEQEKGTIKEFANFSISQSYDFLKAEKWRKGELEPLKEGQSLRDQYPFSNFQLDLTVNPYATIYFSGRMEFDPYYHDFSNGYIYGFTRAKTWRFGLRWDYSKNFLLPLSDLHSLALEGGSFITDNWAFSGWVKYDFMEKFFPYVDLDITYQSQCWTGTLHTYYSTTREGLGIPGHPFVDTHELQFGISISLKNLQSVGPRKFGKFWWGGN